MENNEIRKYIESLNLKENISLEDIPEIDLYMDQVIQLFEKKFSDTLRNEEDKVLTKTMINNYSKGKLFMPVNNKKYTKDHLILISLIYQLKGVLSIKDIKAFLDPMVTKINKGENCDLRGIYSKYLKLYDKNVDDFYEYVEKNMEDIEAIEAIKEEMGDKGDMDNKENFIGDFLLLTSLVTMGNLYKRAAESILDNIIK